MLRSFLIDSPDPDCLRPLLTMALTTDTDVSVPAFEQKEDICLFAVKKIIKTLLTVIN